MLPQTKNLVFKWSRVERCIHYSPSSEPRVALALGDLSVMKKKVSIRDCILFFAGSPLFVVKISLFLLPSNFLHLEEGSGKGMYNSQYELLLFSLFKLFNCLVSKNLHI